MKRSSYRGVSYHIKSGKFVGQIKHEGERIWLGTYTSEEEAARAYDEAAKRLHGPDAQLNFREKDAGQLGATTSSEKVGPEHEPGCIG